GWGAGPAGGGPASAGAGGIGCGAGPGGRGAAGRVLLASRAGIVDTLLATPSFAQHLANRGEPAPNGLLHVVAGGEPGGGIPAVRDHVQAALGVTVNEIMGIGDVAPSLFGECPLQQGMHFCGTGHVWPELIDPERHDPVATGAGR